MLTTQNLNSFLTLGYFLDYRGNDIIPLPQVDTQLYEKVKLNELVEIGSKILLESFSDSFKPNSKHLVPLSGGLDSRSILGALLKFTNSDNINTFTYGIPGTMDYELGRNISKMYGIDNLSINFNNFQFSSEMLLDAAKRFRGQTMLFFHPDHRQLVKMFRNHYYWSGFFGDVAAGDFFSHPKITDRTDIKSLKLKFLKDNLYVRSINLSSEPIEHLSPLLDGLELKIDNINFFEKLEIFNRQTKYTFPHKCPDGFNMVVPYLSINWLNFIMSIPREFRKKGLLYHKILLYTFPDLFNLPTRNLYGLSLNTSEFELLFKRIEYKLLYYFGGKKSIQLKNTNYFNISDFIRNNESLRRIIIDSIMKLKERSIVPWINLDHLLDDHLSGKANYGDALQVLASLEIILTSKE
jgi:hypothetical protein